jgi:hypothetical protein
MSTILKEEKTPTEIIDATLSKKDLMTDAEISALDNAEKVIEKGLKNFVEVGNALKQIRDQKLYRNFYDTFEQYVRERWDIGRAHAYRLIDASQTMEVLSPNGDILPVAESHIRPLLQFDVNDRPAVWEVLVKNLKVNNDRVITAKDIGDHVNLLIKTSCEDNPFKRRRLAIKREKREREERRRNAQPRAEQPKQPAFDLEKQIFSLKEKLHRILGQWPGEHRDMLSKILKELSEQALVSAVTCPHCGCHEADDDGDCLECREPNIVGKKSKRKKAKVVATIA